MRLGVDDMCFACGEKNPIGLKLEFRFEGDEYVTTFQVRPEYQGWAGIAHGGLVATVLDEVMARLLWEKQINAITGKLEVRYHKPVPIGDTPGRAPAAWRPPPKPGPPTARWWRRRGR
jgi:acyl-coenzyme A thioesterase PaaI-like protein